MKKIFFASFICFATIFCASAQNTSEAKSNDNYVGITKTSIIAQYGYAPITSFESWSTNIFGNAVPGTPQQTAEVDHINCFGTVSLGATFCFTDLIELCIPLTYSKGTGEYKGGAEVWGEKGKNFTDNWYSLTPNVKFNWYNSKSGKLRLYSRAGIGIALANRKVTNSSGVNLNSKCAFSFIAAPIGIEYGKLFSVYLDAGIGQTGIVNFGVRYRFRKTKAGYNQDGTAKKYNWYDRYNIDK